MNSQKVQELILSWQQKIDKVREMYTNNPSKNLVQELISTNQKRKEVVKVAVEEIYLYLNKMQQDHKTSLEFFENDRKLKFYFEDRLIWIEGYWNKGIVGLIASRLCNKYNTVTVVLSLNSENE